MWFKTWYYLHPNEKINEVCKQEGCDSKHDITYPLMKKKKVVSKHGGCDSKYDIIYPLGKK